MAVDRVSEGSWAYAELSRHFRPLDACGGYDLNGNGKADFPECADGDNSGAVDAEELRSFLKRNQRRIASTSPFFRTYGQHGIAFDLDNPIHAVLSVESDLTSRKSMQQAYKVLSKLVAEAAAHVEKNAITDPDEAFEAISDIRERNGLQRKKGAPPLLAEALAQKALNDETWFLIEVAVAHELGLPMRLMRLLDGFAISLNRREAKLDEAERRALLTYAYVMRGNALFASRRFAEAVESYGRALAYRPNDAPALEGRGLARIELRAFDEAIADFDRAIAARPTKASLSALRSIAELRASKTLSQVVASIDRALALDPCNVDAYHARGIVAMAIGANDVAIQNFDKELSLQHESAAVRHHRGVALFRSERYEEAIADLDEAIQLDPKNPLSYRYRGEAMRLVGRDKEGERDEITARTLEGNANGASEKGIPKPRADACWAEIELAQRFRPLARFRGFDLNGNGKAEPAEIVDRDDDGLMAAWELEKFVVDHQAKIEPRSNFFKLYFEYRDRFSFDNPIHDLLRIESEHVGPEAIAMDYQAIAGILLGVKTYLKAKSESSPRQKLRAVYSEIEQRMKYNRNGVDYLSQGIAAQELDCDTSSYIVLAIAHEMRWPVNLVTVPGHAFVRWDDGDKVKINMDYGVSFNDSFYLSWPREIAPSSISSGVYLKSLSRQETLGEFYTLWGIVGGSLRHFDNAVELNPDDFYARSSRGYHHFNYDNYELALKDFDRAVELDPLDVFAYTYRGATLYELKQHEAALKDLDKAIELDPQNAGPYHKRWLVKKALGVPKEEAEKDYAQYVKLQKK